MKIGDNDEFDVEVFGDAYDAYNYVMSCCYGEGWENEMDDEMQENYNILTDGSGEGFVDAEGVVWIVEKKRVR